MSKIYSFKSVQVIPVSIEQAWTFFSNPANLKDITPTSLNFTIKSKYHGSTMYEGQIIEYTVSPLFSIPVYWMTEITHIKEGEYFVDEQRFGPYSFWHHQHHFKSAGSGVEMTDIVHYKIPFGVLGDLANALFVEKQLSLIFSHRKKSIEERFGSAH